MMDLSSLGAPHPRRVPRVLRAADRRRRVTPRLSRFSLARGKRSNPRRRNEREGSFVDVYGAQLLLVVLWISLMNVADSFFTIVHLQAGGIELNPVAAMLLETGRCGFVVYKSILIGVALLVLCVHKNFFLARAGLWAAAGTYTLLVAYHVILLAIH